MNAPLPTTVAAGSRRVTSYLACTVLLAAVLTLVSGGVANAADPTPASLRALEQQIAYQINQARLHPKEMAATLKSLKMAGQYHASLSEDPVAKVVTTQADLTQAAAKADVQTALPALAWSETLATYARGYVSAQNQDPENLLGHGPDNPRGFTGPKRATFDGPYRPDYTGPGPIEAIDNAYLADARSFVYDFWISSGEPGNGHRGIVNDAGVTAIGVACGSPVTDHGEHLVACILDAGGGMTDESPVTTSSTGGPGSLAKLSGTIKGDIGATTTTKQSTLTVDTATTATTTPAPAGQTTQKAIPSIATAAPPGARVTASAGPAPNCDYADKSLSVIAPYQAALALRCLIDEARQDAGLVPFFGNSGLDDLATAYVQDGDVTIAGPKACPSTSQVVSSSKLRIFTGFTTRGAYQAALQANGSGVFTSRSTMYMGVAYTMKRDNPRFATSAKDQRTPFGDGSFGVVFATCS